MTVRVQRLTLETRSRAPRAGMAEREKVTV